MSRWMTWARASAALAAAAAAALLVGAAPAVVGFGGSVALAVAWCCWLDRQSAV